MIEKKITTAVLKNVAGKMGLKLNKIQLFHLDLYFKELLCWNERINLISRTETRDCELVIKHIIDSMTPVLSNEIKGGAKLIDVGTGGGLPGIVLQIIEPTLKLTLLEPVAKKCLFLRHVLSELGFNDAEVICQRAESFGRGQARESFDVAVARATAPLPALLELSLPLVRIGGHLIAQKGKKAEEEVASAIEAAAILGGKIEKVTKIEPPELEAERYLVVVKKLSATPPDYPRRDGVPAKRPLGGGKKASRASRC